MKFKITFYNGNGEEPIMHELFDTDRIPKLVRFHGSIEITGYEIEPVKEDLNN